MAVMGWVQVKGSPEGDRLVSGVQGLEKLVQTGSFGAGVGCWSGWKQLAAGGKWQK